MTSADTWINFVRHGDVENPRDIIYGRLPRIRLSERGHSQAAAVARRLSRPDVVYASPRLRARQTAAAIASACGGMRVSTSRYLDETRTGAEGLPRSVVEATGWDLSRFATEESETADDILRRMQRFLKLVTRRHRGENVVAVSHGDPIAILLAWVAKGVVVRGGVRDALSGLGLDYPVCGAVVGLVLKGSDSKWALELLRGCK